MPIASELDNTRRLKSVGFTEAQAEVLAEIASLRGKLRAELHSSLRDQMLKFIIIFSALLGLAIAIIKLFPDVN